MLKKMATDQAAPGALKNEVREGIAKGRMGEEDFIQMGITFSPNWVPSTLPPSPTKPQLTSTKPIADYYEKHLEKKGETVMPRPFAKTTFGKGVSDPYSL